MPGEKCTYYFSCCDHGALSFPKVICSKNKTSRTETKLNIKLAFFFIQAPQQKWRRTLSSPRPDPDGPLGAAGLGVKTQPLQVPTQPWDSRATTRALGCLCASTCTKTSKASAWIIIPSAATSTRDRLNRTSFHKQLGDHMSTSFYTRVHLV